LLHLTNPKAILVWVSIVALSSNNSGSAYGAVIPGCAVIGCLVFSGYAWAATINGSGVATFILAGSEESKAA
jgi:threonine/homoserine/homoserine lactone efflux protein